MNIFDISLDVLWVWIFFASAIAMGFYSLYKVAVSFNKSREVSTSNYQKYGSLLLGTVEIYFYLDRELRIEKLKSKRLKYHGTELEGVYIYRRNVLEEFFDKSVIYSFHSGFRNVLKEEVVFKVVRDNKNSRYLLYVAKTDVGRKEHYIGFIAKMK